jgi:hypothetical protein
LGKRAVTELERKHLVETDRHIAECEAYIAKQRDLIERAIEQGRSTEVAEETLRGLRDKSSGSSLPGRPATGVE